MYSFIRNQPPPSNTIVSRPLNESTSSFGLTRTSSSVNFSPQQNKTKSVTPCGHHDHGQDLCLVCHQRAKRNIPVYLHEEKRVRETEDEKLLEQYQHDRDVDEHKKREVNLKRNFHLKIFVCVFIQAAMKAAREEKQRIAAVCI